MMSDEITQENELEINSNNQKKPRAKGSRKNAIE